MHWAYAQTLWARALQDKWSGKQLPARGRLVCARCGWTCWRATYRPSGCMPGKGSAMSIRSRCFTRTPDGPPFGCTNMPYSSIKMTEKADVFRSLVERRPLFCLQGSADARQLQAGQLGQDALAAN